MRPISSIILIAAALIVGCSKNQNKTKTNEILLNLTGEMFQVNTQTIIQDQENPANYYSSVDSIAKYGYGYRITLPDSLKEETLKIIIEAKVKETESVTGEFVVSINDATMNALFWDTRSTNGKLNQLNVWTPFKDSILIDPYKNGKQGMNLYILNAKFKGKGMFSVDDFKVKITKE